MQETKKARRALTIRRFPAPYFISSIIFIAAFIAVFLVSLFNNQNNAVVFSPLWLCLYAGLGAGVIFVIAQFFVMLPEPTAKREGLIFFVLMLIIVALQIYVALNFASKDLSYYGAQPFRLAVAHIAEKKAPGNYFILHPEQIGAYTWWNLFVFIVEAFGVENYTLFGIVANIVIIDIALFVFYRCVRSVLGGLRAMVGFIVYIFTLPFLVYAPIFSTEILALPVVAMMVFLWAKARRAWRNEEYEAFYFGFFSMCLFAVVGALIHTAVLLLWVIVMMDFLFLLRGPLRKAVVFGLGLIVTMGLFTGGFLYLRSSPLLLDHNYSGNIVPIKYYIIAAWSPDEKEDQAYLQEIMAQEGQPAKDAKTEEIFEEIFEGKSIQEKLFFFADRVGVLFGDGLQNAQNRYSADAKDETVFAFLTSKTSPIYSVSAYFAFAIWAATILWSIVGSILSTLRRNNYFGFVRAFIVIYTAYMLLFSPTSGAMLLILPLFMLLMTEALAPKPGEHLVAVVEKAPEQDEMERSPFPGVDEDTSTSLLLSNKEYKRKDLTNLSDTGWMRAIEGESLLTDEVRAQEPPPLEDQMPFVSSYETARAAEQQAQREQQAQWEAEALGVQQHQQHIPQQQTSRDAQARLFAEQAPQQYIQQQQNAWESPPPLFEEQSVHGYLQGEYRAPVGGYNQRAPQETWLQFPQHYSGEDSANQQYQPVAPPDAARRPQVQGDGRLELRSRYGAGPPQPGNAPYPPQQRGPLQNRETQNIDYPPQNSKTANRQRRRGTPPYPPYKSDKDY